MMKIQSIGIGLVFILVSIFGLDTSAQESLSSDTIIDALAPKSKTRSLRPSSEPMSAEDKAFIGSLSVTTRSISVEERKKVFLTNI